MTALLAVLHLHLLRRVALGDRERGDVPGWVLITVMTAALVTVIWGLLEPQITTLLSNVLDGVSGPRRYMRTAGDDGSGVVDFILVTVLLLLLFLGVVQVGIVLHTRNVLIAAAAEGARYGANADRTPEQGAERARRAVADTLSAEAAAQALIGATTSLGPDGLQTVQVDVSAAVPVLLLPVGPVRLTVRGHALEEG